MYKKHLQEFPEIVDKMIEYQVTQGNLKNVKVFEDYPFADFTDGGFDKTPTKGKIFGNR